MVKVGRAVLDDLDSHDFLGFEVLALDHLAECALAEDVEDKITIPNNDQSSSDKENRGRTCAQLPRSPICR